MVNSASKNNPLCVGRDCSYGPSPGLSDSLEQAATGAHPRAFLIGSGAIMKTVAVTVAVLALGLAACNKAADNNAANDTAVENTATTDVNVATNDAVTANADAALNAPATDNAVENTGNATENK